MFQSGSVRRLMTIGCIRFHRLCLPYFFYSGVPMAHKIRVTVLKCFFLFQFHTTCCFNNIMIYFMSLFGVYSSRILSTVAMLVTCVFNRGFFFLSYSVYVFICLMTPHFPCFYAVLIYSFLDFFFPFNFWVLPSSFLSFCFCFLFTFYLYIPSFSISLNYWNNFIKMIYIEEGEWYSVELIQQWSVLCTKKWNLFSKKTEFYLCSSSNRYLKLQSKIRLQENFRLCAA
jgi:hypothetical protein